MPYKVHKIIDDRRNNTCGFFIPNGGFYHVIEMTFENHLNSGTLVNGLDTVLTLLKEKRGSLMPMGLR